MILCLPTIQHTGTKFTASLFWESCNWRGFADPVEKDSFHVGHITQIGIRDILPLIQKHTTIVPLRHPYLVAESWKRRNKPEHELIWNYSTLIGCVAKYTDYFFPVDAENRKEHLENIAKGLNREIKTDWLPVNSKKETYDLTWRDIEPSSEMVSFVKNHQEFINQFWPT